MPQGGVRSLELELQVVATADFGELDSGPSGRAASSLNH